MNEKPKNPDTKEDNIEIEKRIEKELNRLREQADKELNHLRELTAGKLKHLHDNCNKEINILNITRESRWKFIAMAATLFAVVFPYLIVKPYIKNYINERLIGPELGKIASSKELFEFTLTYIQSQSDDSEAFEQLGRWGANKEYEYYPFRIVAQNTYDTIRRIYMERILPVRRPILPQVINRKMFTDKEYLKMFKDAPQTFHADIVNLIWDNKELSEGKKMELLIDVISGTNTSNSLNAKYFAGHILAKRLGINFEPFDYNPITEKYEEYRKGTTTTKGE